MSVSGMKKQLHKASQLLNERLMGAEGTRMDDDFLKMEKSIAVFYSLLMELLSRTTEFLQPNPGTETNTTKRYIKYFKLEVYKVVNVSYPAVYKVLQIRSI
uniref:BAR domain-containing protein n=1 Tax=Mastacembelus armatus TaxID=205130 RepID=A0A3Q3MAB3_9TELE